MLMLYSKEGLARGINISFLLIVVDVLLSSLKSSTYILKMNKAWGRKRTLGTKKNFSDKYWLHRYELVLKLFLEKVVQKPEYMWAI